MKIFRGRKKYIVLLLFLLIILVYPPLSYKKLSNPNTKPSNIIKGVFHIHSNFSDGKGDVNEIAGAAAYHKLDFVILTDHGEPNLKCIESTAFHDNVLLIGGSEFSLDCGHLASAGFMTEKYRIPPEPQEAVNYVKRNKGFSFISHPFDKKIPWKDWRVSDFTGIEVLSSYSSARRISAPRLLAFPFRYLLNHEYALLGSLDYPEENLRTWDSFNGKGKYMGIFALDAHAQIPITKNIFFHFPSYRSIFSTLNIYIKIRRPLPHDPIAASAVIIDCIRAGRYFNVIEAISSANGFNVIFRSSSGTDYETGETTGETAGVIRLDLPFEFPVRISVIRDGKQYLLKQYGPFTSAEIPVNTAGVYRCEVFTDRGRFRELPWIVTNPFFIGSGSIEEKEPFQAALRRPAFTDPEPFHIEKNEFSTGSVRYEEGEDTQSIVNMEYILKGKPGERDYWVSLASRTKLDLSDFKGISFDTRSSEEMVYWVEIRSSSGKEEYWYRHSFTAPTGWRQIHIPFNRFHLISKNRDRQEIDLSSIHSLFFSINNSILNIPEFSGRLEIRDITVVK